MTKTQKQIIDKISNEVYSTYISLVSPNPKYKESEEASAGRLLKAMDYLKVLSELEE